MLKFNKILTKTLTIPKDTYTVNQQFKTTLTEQEENLLTPYTDLMLVKLIVSGSCNYLHTYARLCFNVGEASENCTKLIEIHGSNAAMPSFTFYANTLLSRLISYSNSSCMHTYCGCNYGQQYPVSFSIHEPRCINPPTFLSAEVRLTNSATANLNQITVTAEIYV